MFTLMASGSAPRAHVGAVILAAIAGAVSATAATALSGGLTPLVEQLPVDRTGSAFMPGMMLAVVALCVLPVLVTLRETAAGRGKLG